MVDTTKLNEFENGLKITGGISLLSGEGIPAPLDPEENSFFYEENGSIWFYNGVWQLKEFKGKITKSVPKYSSGELVGIIYYNGANKIVEIDIDFTSGLPSTETHELYDTDGTTLLWSKTYTFSYTDGEINQIDKVEL